MSTRRATGKPAAKRPSSSGSCALSPIWPAPIAQLHPKGLAGNKQLVADLIRGGHFTLLTLLYNLKNRRK